MFLKQFIKELDGSLALRTHNLKCHYHSQNIHDIAVILLRFTNDNDVFSEADMRQLPY